MSTSTTTSFSSTTSCSSSLFAFSTDACFFGLKPSKLPSKKDKFFGACRDVDEYIKGEKVGEGTYGVVYHVQDKHDPTQQQYAVKRIRIDKENDGFPVPSVREVSLLRQLKHKNIVHVQDVVVSDILDGTFMLMEFCDRDLATILDSLDHPGGLSSLEVKCLMYQLLNGMTYLHHNFIVHRDLKLANLLLTSQGILKIADFGLARKFSLPPKAMTPKVVTLWYRPPELLLGTKIYNVAVDNWSIGCIFGELILCSPLLPGKSEIEQVSLIITLLGTPTEDRWPGWTLLPNAHIVTLPQVEDGNFSQKFNLPNVESGAVELLSAFLMYDPIKRITCLKALKHVYFTGYTLDETILQVNPKIRQLMQVSLEKSQTLRDITKHEIMRKHHI